jgi:hypothetical protein
MKNLLLLALFGLIFIAPIQADAGKISKNKAYSRAQRRAYALATKRRKAWARYYYYHPYHYGYWKNRYPSYRPNRNYRRPATRYPKRVYRPKVYSRSAYNASR